MKLLQILGIGILSLFIVYSVSSCTDNQRAKNFGGSGRLEVPCGHKVINITWKKDQLWYSTIPMEEGYIPQVHTFREHSSFGMLEGKYLLIEKKCK